MWHELSLHRLFILDFSWGIHNLIAIRMERRPYRWAVPGWCLCPICPCHPVLPHLLFSLLPSSCLSLFLVLYSLILGVWLFLLFSSVTSAITFFKEQGEWYSCDSGCYCTNSYHCLRPQCPFICIHCLLGMQWVDSWKLVQWLTIVTIIFLFLQKQSTVLFYSFLQFLEWRVLGELPNERMVVPQTPFTTFPAT